MIEKSLLAALVATITLPFGVPFSDVATFSSGFEERTSTSVSCEARTSLWPSRSLTVSYSNFPANSIKADT